MTKAAELAKMGEVLTNSQIGGRRNIIINGAMQVAQRGTSSTSNGFLLDRFNIQNVSDGAFSATQDSSAPTGFENSLKIEVTTADTSLSATQNLRCEYRVEGKDMFYLDWGTSNAKTITLSFYVKSSLTGTFSGAINNSDFNRAYPFTYTISSANTWEYKTVKIDGDTTGTWLVTNGIGMNICWSLGAGSSRVGTADAWAAVNVQGVSGQVELIGTVNATWQMTGVQLEVGEQATPFEHRSFGEELALCQRYHYRIVGNEVNNASDGGFAVTTNWDNSYFFITLDFPTQMRAGPSMSFGAALSDFLILQAGATNAPTAISLNGASKQRCEMNFLKSGGFGSAGTSGWIRIVDNTNGFIAFDSEL
jgi:hypothetical protein